MERSIENHDKKQYMAAEKVMILRRHLIDKVTVPDLCDEYHLHPSVFYRWLKQFFDNGAATFAPTDRLSRREEAQRERIEAPGGLIASMRSGAFAPRGSTLPFPVSYGAPHRTIDPYALKTPAAQRRNFVATRNRPHSISG